MVWAWPPGNQRAAVNSCIKALLAVLATPLRNGLCPTGQQAGRAAQSPALRMRRARYCFPLSLSGCHLMKRLLATLATVLALTGCGYNDFQRLDEQTKSAWKIGRASCRERV